MKLQLCFLLLLCIFLTASAQEKQLNINKGTALDSTRSGLKNLLTGGIQVGEKVPDLIIKNIHGLRLNGQLITEAHLSDFKGTPVIIDFWATWCGPCRTLMYHLDSLRKVFGNKVIFLPVTYESQAVAAPVLNAMQQARPFDLPDVTGDIELQRLFPHRSLPHEVWLDGNGVVRGITEHDQLTTANIKRLLIGDNLAMSNKQDVKITFDKTKPLLIDGNGGDGGQLVWHSMLSKYIPGISGSLEITDFDPVKGQRYTVRNAPLQLIYALSFGEKGRVFPKARVRILTRDSVKINTNLKGQAYRDWLAAGNGWCYEQVLPPYLADNGFSLMQEDLRRLFPAYLAKVEMQTIPSLVLIRTTTDDKLKSAGLDHKVDIGPFYVHLRNASIRDLMLRLEHQYMQGSKLPIANGTNYTGPVDMDLEVPLSDLGALNKALAPYGLAFIEKDYPAELLTISDHDTLKQP